MKKRISLIVGLILCATIFTVYAAWVYAEGTIDPIDSTSSINITIEGATSETKGTLAIANGDSGALAIALGDNEETAAYDIVETFSGSAVITFTSEPTATVPVQPKDITLKCVLTITGTDPVYEVVNGGVVALSFDEGTGKWTITADALNAAVNLKPYDISTYANYQAYAARVAATGFTLTISEVVAGA